MFEIGKLLKLSDEKIYIVVSSATEKGKNYYYLLENGNVENAKFCVEKQKNNKIFLELVKDFELMERIFPKFQKNSKKFLNTEE